MVFHAELQICVNCEDIFDELYRIRLWADKEKLILPLLTYELNLFKFVQIKLLGFKSLNQV